MRLPAVSHLLEGLRPKHAALLLIALVLIAGFVSLGNWQLERREWKQALIQAVEQRAHAPAQRAPEREHWALISRSNDEYRHVVVRGRFLQSKPALVVAATELGSGYWVLTPFQCRDGSVVFINRGYIGQGLTPAGPPEGEVEVSGLLRISEPDGSPLRKNKPSADRWYSRDIEAIALARGLIAAPFFIDAAQGAPGSRQVDPANASDADNVPVGGLTVIQFHDNHLVYSLTWYGLAAMVVVAFIILLREARIARECHAVPD